MAVQLTEFKRTSRARLEKQVAAAEALRALVRELLVQQGFLRDLALGHAAQDRGLRGTVLLQVGLDDRLDVRVRARQASVIDLASHLERVMVQEQAPLFQSVSRVVGTNASDDARVNAGERAAHASKRRPELLGEEEA